ncbi:hypothetical protein BGZ83_005720 [Gryganskiella cystojenkinii]|nr:hypothetical protein BGZ83_005720 [Gryganskiella cystojenkinii]
MSSIHQRYYQLLLHVHNGLRKQLKQCLRTLPDATQPSAVKSVCRSTLQFCEHLLMHHDIEEESVFPAFAAVTNISHWSNSHDSLHKTLDKVRQLAQEGLNQDGRDFLQKQALINELETLSDIVLPHLSDEEFLSHPDESIKLWPTERDMRRAFPWF